MVRSGESFPPRTSPSISPLVQGAALLFLSTFWLSAAPQPVSEETVEKLLPKIERYTEEARQQWGTPGIAIGIVAQDRLVYAKGFGVKKLGETDAVDADTVFEIGSTSKAVLAATQAIQIDDGSYEWEDRVIDLLPDFRLADPWVTREFQVVDLLAQRSGLPPFALTDMALYGYESGEIIRAIREIKPVSSFRSSFAYQNAFHLVAGEIIARTSGKASWGDFLRERLLIPLGMKATDDRAEQILKGSNLASGHRWEEGKVAVDPRSLFPYNVVPAGGLNSSVNDMAQWLRLLIAQGEVGGQRLISAGALRATWTPRIALEGPIKAAMGWGEDDQLSYGNGWFIHSLPEGRIVEHGGSTVGFTAFVGFDPDRKVGVVALSNLSYNGGYGSAHVVGPYILSLLMEREPGDPSGRRWAVQQQILEKESKRYHAAPEASPPRRLASYTGAYESPVLGRITISNDAERALRFELGPKKLPVELLPISEDRFKARVTLHSDHGKGYTLTGEATFAPDRHGRPERFILDTLDSEGQPPFTRLPEESGEET